MLKSDSHDELLVMLSVPSKIAWQNILEFWAVSDHVYSGPAGPDGWISPEYDLAQLIPVHFQEAENHLASGLTNSNATVVAYCIVSLNKLYDLKGRFLPPKYAKLVEHRSESINETFGCFGSRPTLARFAAKFVDNYGVESQSNSNVG